MDVVVHPHTRRAAFGSCAPVGEQGVAEHDLAVAIPEPWLAAGTALPDAKVVTDIRFVAGTAEELPAYQAVLIVHARVDLGVDFELRRDERVPRHVTTDEPRGVRQPIRKTARGGQQEQVRTPAVARRENERSRTVLDRIVRTIAMDSLCRRD